MTTGQIGFYKIHSNLDPIGWLQRPLLTYQSNQKGLKDQNWYQLTAYTIKIAKNMAYHIENIKNTLYGTDFV